MSDRRPHAPFVDFASRHHKLVHGTFAEVMQVPRTQRLMMLSLLEQVNITLNSPNVETEVCLGPGGYVAAIKAAQLGLKVGFPYNLVRNICANGK